MMNDKTKKRLIIFAAISLFLIAVFVPIFTNFEEVQMKRKLNIPNNGLNYFKNETSLAHSSGENTSLEPTKTLSDTEQFRFSLLYTVDALALDSENKVNIAMGLNKIVTLSSDGKEIGQITLNEWGEDSFLLSKFAYDSVGNVFVLDYRFNEIGKFSEDGELITRWGEEGVDDGQFKKPSSIAVDSEDNIWVADSETNRIQKFTNNGEFIKKIEIPEPPYFCSSKYITFDSKGSMIVAHSTYWKYCKGSSYKQFEDVPFPLIHKIPPDSKDFTKWESFVPRESKFMGFHSIALDEFDNMYVLDYNDILKFNPKGQLIFKITKDYARYNSLSTGLLTDKQNNFYVLDSYYILEKFDSNGNRLWVLHQ